MKSLMNCRARVPVIRNPPAESRIVSTTDTAKPSDFADFGLFISREMADSPLKSRIGKVSNPLGR